VVTADQLPAFGPATAAPPAGRRLLARALTRPSLAALLALVVVVAVFGARSPELLGSAGGAAVLDTAATLGIGGVAVALLLIAGQFDLSIGVVGVGSALVSALLIQEAGWGTWPALGVSLACALVVGLVNGVLVVSTGMPSFLATLATFLVLDGATVAGAHLLTGTVSIDGLQSAPGWASAAAVFDSTLRLGDGTFHVAVLWCLAATALASWVLWRTRFGNAVMASGGARRAARELGVHVRRTTITLFCLTATAGWLIGAMGLLRSGGVQVSPGLSQDVDFLVVAVIGGSLLGGGYGSPVGAAVGALVYAVAREGIVLAGWDPRWFQTLLGVLLVVALLANGVVRSRLKAVPRS
jgi:simple sugar transport system permease protein